MANTSIHLPAELLEELNRLARESGRSRNRLIVEACAELVRRRGQRWPAGFFDGDDLSDADLQDLRANEREFLASVQSARRSRRTSPL